MPRPIRRLAKTLYALILLASTAATPNAGAPAQDGHGWTIDPNGWAGPRILPAFAGSVGRTEH